MSSLEKVLASRSTAALESVKNVLRKKGKMRTCQFYLCDSCDKPIHNPDKGFVVHGNVYVADPCSRGGLIGNNFPDVSPGDKIEVTDVQESVYCASCFMRILGLNNTQHGHPKKYDKKEEKLDDEDFINQLRDDEDFINQLRDMV